MPYVLAILFYFSGICFVLLGWLILTDDKKSVSRRIYFGASLVIAIWCLSYALMTTASSEDTARMFWSIGITSNFLFYVMWSHFLSYLTSYRTPAIRHFIAILYVVAFVYPALIIASNSVVVERTDFGYLFTYASSLHFLVFGAFFFSVLAIMFFLQIKWIQLSKVARQKKAAILFTILTSTVAISVITLEYVIPAVFGLFVVPLAAFFILIITFAFFNIMKEYRVLDITVRNVSEEVFSLSGQPILVLNSENRVLIANRKAEEFWEQKLVGLNAEELLVNVPFSESATTNVRVEIGSDIRNCNMMLSVLRDRYGDVVHKVAVIDDDTILLDALASAEKANRSKSNFLATMSHELRTPLNAILGIAGIELERENIATETENALQRVIHAARTLLSILNDILDFSKIESGKFDLANVRYETASLINDTIRINSMLIENKPIEFKLIISEDLPAEMYGDELRIRQILNNLLSNAFKYTERGTVTLEITSRPYGGGACLTFIVSDTGQGMSPEQVERLFDNYSRFNAENNYGKEGTGLGMGITKGLVEMMDGEISVKSALDVGSVFTVTLMQFICGEETVGKELVDMLQNFRFNDEPETTKITREYMPYGKVLIVDDVEANLYVAKRLLEPYGIKTETCMSGYDSYIKVKRGNEYDIIFMDYMMPEMDGIEATTLIRETGYEKPIVALTANALVGSEEMFLRNGFDGFVSKPIDARRFDFELNRFIRDAHPEEAEKYKGKEVINEEPEPDSKLLGIFRKDAESTIVAMREALVAYDKKLFAIKVHAMKAALANIGEIEMADTAAALEARFNLKKAEKFISDLEKLVAEIPVMQVSQTNTAPVDASLVAEIIAACEEYDDEAVYRALERMSDSPIKKEIHEAIYMRSDFEEAAELANKLNTGGDSV